MHMRRKSGRMGYSNDCPIPWFVSNTCHLIENMISRFRSYDKLRKRPARNGNIEFFLWKRRKEKRNRNPQKSTVPLHVATQLILVFSRLSLVLQNYLYETKMFQWLNMYMKSTNFKIKYYLITFLALHTIRKLIQPVLLNNQQIT